MDELLDAVVNTVKKKRPKGCYSPGGVLVTHKGVQLTSMSVDKVC